MIRETRSSRRVDAATRASARVGRAAAVRRRVVPHAGPAGRLDRISINNAEWEVKIEDKVGIRLYRARERRADMPSEQRQAERDAFNKYHKEV